MIKDNYNLILFIYFYFLYLSTFEKCAMSTKRTRLSSSGLHTLQQFLEEMNAFFLLGMRERESWWFPSQWIASQMEWSWVTSEWNEMWPLKFNSSCSIKKNNSDDSKFDRREGSFSVGLNTAWMFFPWQLLVIWEFSYTSLQPFCFLS